MHPPSLLCMSWLFGLGIVAVRAEVAEFGACYNPASKALSCDFNSSFCRPECVKWNSGSQAVASNCEEWGPTLTWKKPSEVAAMGESCSCRETHVGSCYPCVATETGVQNVFQATGMGRRRARLLSTDKEVG